MTWLPSLYTFDNCIYKLIYFISAYIICI
ncbi:hypothetical protein F383_34930 [Gossypium arboreum]|uniref:Uncharacterized protein n=1 Tax=Gossypium arboreum TaxID=29729 RepID=A0A0B0NAE9_GOSAR|nr:hypothetical protein F383_34930 [Gossypium arboreum]